MEVRAATARLAHALRLGTVGIVGAYALGDPSGIEALEVLVSVPLDSDLATRYGTELAELAGIRVVLHDVYRLPWASPLHVSVRWMNVDRLPRVPCPKGAKSRLEVAGGEVALVQLDTLAHFYPVDGFVSAPSGRASRGFLAPVGGFLL